MFSHARRLRWSGETLGYEVNLLSFVDHSADFGVPGARALSNLVDAFAGGINTEMATQRVLDELGKEGLVDAAAVFGNFEMMNRVAEGTGIPVPPQAVEREAELMKTLGLYDILKSQQF